MTLADSFRRLALFAPDAPPDSELVGRYARTRDEEAFAELLRRHGPTVYGVCRRVLRNGPDADDAFQAVFLVLARRAGTLGEPGAVGNWLYGVAVRTANKARVLNAKEANRRRPPPVPLDEYPAADGDPADADTLAVIDAELAALSDHYCAAFVTCVLNGRSRAEAARDLGWPEGTVAARLAKARELLVARLRKRGVTLAAGTFAAVAVPTAAASGALDAVRELSAVGTASAVAPAAQTLSDEVVRTMTTSYPKGLAAAGVLAVARAVGAAVLAAGAGERPPVPEPIRASAPVPKDGPMEWKEGKPIRFDPDPHGDRITGVAYSPDGKFIAVAVGNQVRLLDATTRKQVNEHALTAKAPATITSVAFSPKGDRLAVTAKDFVFLYSDLGKSPSVSSDRSWKVDSFDPHQVVWFADADGGEHLVATNGAETRHRDSNGKEQAYTGWPVFRHQPSLLAAVPGRDGWLMQFDSDKDPRGTADFWLWTPGDLKGCRRLTGHPHRPESGAVSGDGKVIVTGDGARHVVVWDGETFKKKVVVEVEGGVKAVAVTNDGKTTAVLHGIAHAPKNALPGGEPDTKNVTCDLMVTVYDTASLAKSDKAGPRPLLSWKTDEPLRGGRGGPVSLAFSPDGRTLLAAFADPYTDGTAERSMGVRVWEWVPRK